MNEISSNLSSKERLNMNSESRKIILQMVSDKMSKSGRCLIEKKDFGNTVGVVAAKIQNNQKLIKNKEDQGLIYQALAEKVAQGKKNQVLKSELDWVFDFVGNKLIEDGMLYKNKSDKEKLLNDIERLVNGKDSKVCSICKKDLEEIVQISVAKKELDQEFETAIIEEKQIYEALDNKVESDRKVLLPTEKDFLKENKDQIVSRKLAQKV